MDLFEAKVVTEPNSGCWLWLGAANSRGYGWVRRGGKTYLAHRFAWTRARGAIPHGMSVLHRCDVPCCVNPDHLFLGTRADNNADMVAKGRQARGEKKLRLAKLSESQVHEIRSRVAAGESQRSIARAFEICQPHVGCIARGERWAHVR